MSQALARSLFQVESKLHHEKSLILLSILFMRVFWPHYPAKQTFYLRTFFYSVYSLNQDAEKNLYCR
jgi:hypothetical protein